MKLDLFTGGSADFSADRVYRYDLRRIWDSSKKLVVFILLNPMNKPTEIETAYIKIKPVMRRAFERSSTLDIEYAVYSDDRPPEFWLRVPGFEAKP